MTLAKQLHTVRVFVRISTKRFFRDRLAIFFTVVFPLIFLFVFGGIFGKNSGASFNVAIINQSQEAFASDLVKQLTEGDVIKNKPNITTLEQADEKMSRSEIDAALILPPDFGKVQAGQSFPSGTLEVRYSQNNEQAAQTLATVLEGQLQAVNTSLVRAEVPFRVEATPSNTKGLSRFDYTFAGLLGFSIIGIGIFGPINVFPELKKQGILRRLHTTPLRVWQYFVANALSNAVIGLLTMVVLFAVAMTVFDLNLVGNIFELALFISMSIITILGIGLAIGGWAKNERQAAPLANIVVFPMMFLSGTFFPRFAMPVWLQNASTYLPLTPVIDGIRLIATEGKHIWEIGPQAGLVVAWGIVVYLIAFRVFRWE